jgi:hypothetical protein
VIEVAIASACARRWPHLANFVTLSACQLNGVRNTDALFSANTAKNIYHAVLFVNKHAWISAQAIIHNVTMPAALKAASVQKVWFKITTVHAYNQLLASAIWKISSILLVVRLLRIVKYASALMVRSIAGRMLLIARLNVAKILSLHVMLIVLAYQSLGIA